MTTLKTLVANLKHGAYNQQNANIARHEAEQARQRKAKCTVCGRRVRLVGMADHMRDAHGERPGALSQ